jgi:AcrR family transcriptional regulator
VHAASGRSALLYDRPTLAHAPETGRPRRRDAERNRETILAAARDAFADGGVVVGVDQIAKRAGVGPATLYRHFPSKAALVDAVLEESAAAVCESVRSSLESPDAATSLREFVHCVIDVQMRDRSFRDLLAWHDAESAAEVPALTELGGLLVGVVEKAHEAGVLSRGVTVGDFVLMLVAFDGVSAPTGEIAESAMHRLADIAVDGLLSGATALDGVSLDLVQVGEVAKYGRGLPVRPAS